MLFTNGKTNQFQQPIELNKSQKLAKLAEIEPNRKAISHSYKVQMIWHTNGVNYLGGASACVTSPSGHVIFVPLSQVNEFVDLVQEVEEFVNYLSLWEGTARSEETTWNRLQEWINQRGQTANS
jgi:hypothetical protein